MGVIDVRVIYNEDDAGGKDVEFDMAVKNFFKSLGFRAIISYTGVDDNRHLCYTRVLKKEAQSDR